MMNQIYLLVVYFAEKELDWNDDKDDSEMDL